MINTILQGKQFRSRENIRFLFRKFLLSTVLYKYLIIYFLLYTVYSLYM